ncbi:MAG: hypothetical protein EOO14_23685 [Chitinophagaceae bacterium]|nr:MAG: hypothetical protein EOO14_23685 [Chitinophagaceae bacterium]
MEAFVKHSVRPDERRSKDSTEAPKHFIDLEGFGEEPAHQMPHDWKVAVAKYSEDSLVKYGFVPYWVITMQERLTNAFRVQNSDSILFYATDLAHYIQDAHVPLHTTINYDGQLTNQKGLHSLWESMVPELTLESFNLKARKKARYVKKPEEKIWEAVRGSFALVPGVLQIEKEASTAFTDSTKYRWQKRNGRDVRYYTKDFALAYAKLLEPTVNQQALEAANLVADFWYTAWVDAGKPALQSLQAKAWDKTTEEALKKEVKAYRKNRLLKEGLLLSKKETARGGE